ncbi:unnamed protein product [Musa banksii]
MWLMHTPFWLMFGRCCYSLCKCVSLKFSPPSSDRSEVSSTANKHIRSFLCPRRCRP